MIVVHVRKNHVFDSLRIDADGLQSLTRRMQKLTPALARHGFVEARVDHQVSPVAGLDRPDEIIERHGAVVKIGRQGPEKILVSQALMMRVANRVSLPNIAGHMGYLSCCRC